MGDNGEKDKAAADDDLFKDAQPNAGMEDAVKHGYEDKRAERGIGNRAPSKPPQGERKTEFSVAPLFKWESNLKGAVQDSRGTNPRADQTTFAQLLQFKVSDGEALSASVNLTEAKAKAVLFKGKVEASVVHAEADLVDMISKLFVSEVKKPPAKSPPVPPVMPAPMAARLGDMTAHGSPLVPGIGSANVFVGGLPAWRAGMDLHLCPFPAPVPHGIGLAVPGAPTVLINGAPAARAGDALMEPIGGPNLILLGCPTVLIGAQATPPPPPPVAPEPEKAAELPWVKLESVAKGDAKAVEAEAQFYGEVDLAKGAGVAELQVGAMGALLKGEIPLKVRLRVPSTEYYLGLGVTLEGSLISAGAEAGAGFTVNHGGKAFDWTGGAKVGAGLGGIGVKFGVDVAK
ncbi:MAG: motif-containing protein [Myxococcaceae bacterium]|nr:motif-containing protein [Myxococcaceae bacterium]